MSREYVLERFRPAINLEIDYAGELNSQQHAAVTAPPGPSLVLAGAGAGKTRTLIYRVAFLLEQGIPTDRILLLTFTNKAAREMMRRVTALLERDYPDLWGGTFHSVGHRVLRRHAEAAGYRPQFTILDREDARDFLKTCVEESGLDDASVRFPKAEVLADIFSMAANTCNDVGSVLESRYPHFSQLTDSITELARQYGRRKKSASVMDFDDLLTEWLALLRAHPDVLERYQRKFQFILVDEYQDTNLIQADLVDLLAARHQNLMVVGDDSQSIYSWRGANFRNILEFPNRYPKARVFKIETNYRSTPEILDLANAAISANHNQFPKQLTPARPSGQKPVLVACGDSDEQASFVAQRVLELREEGIELSRMAVLYRSHFHALELQLELTRRNIPFSITSGIRFFEQAHIKDVTAYLKLICNPAEELAFKRIAQLLPGIGAKAAAKLWQTFQVALGRGGPVAEKSPVAAAVQGCSAVAPKKSAIGWTELAVTLSQIESPEMRAKPAAMIETVCEAGYADYLEATYTNYRSRQDDLEQLAAFAGRFADLEEFLTQLSLLSNLETEGDLSAEKDREQIRLSTIHQAKGLEFDVVFLIMLCDGLFPSARSLDSLQDEEEERRLFYVAITRARDELYLSYPLIRVSPGRGGDLMQQPSRFLGDVDAELIDEWNLRSSGNAY